MYIKAEPTTRQIIIREIEGSRLEAPITVTFSENGVARVKDGVGEWLIDNLPGAAFYGDDEHTEEDG